MTALGSAPICNAEHMKPCQARQITSVGCCRDSCHAATTAFGFRQYPCILLAQPMCVPPCTHGFHASAVFYTSPSVCATCKVTNITSASLYRWHFSPVTLSSCALMVSLLWQLSTDHSLTSPLQAPVARVTPSGENSHAALGRSSAISLLWFVTCRKHRCYAVRSNFTCCTRLVTCYLTVLIYYLQDTDVLWLCMYTCLTPHLIEINAQHD